MEPESTATMTDGSPVPAHLARVVAERDELTDRCLKLVTFFDNSIFAGLAAEEQSDLRSQADVMAEYGKILNRRLERAGVID